MSNVVTNNSNNDGFWTSFKHWLRAFDDIVHGDPSDALARKVEQLEARLSRIENTKPGHTA